MSSTFPMAVLVKLPPVHRQKLVNFPWRTCGINLFSLFCLPPVLFIPSVFLVPLEYYYICHYNNTIDAFSTIKYQGPPSLRRQAMKQVHLIGSLDRPVFSDCKLCEEFSCESGASFSMHMDDNYQICVTHLPYKLDPYEEHI